MNTYILLEASHTATQVTILLVSAYHFYTRVAIQNGKYETAISKYSALTFRLTACSFLILFLFHWINRIVILS